MNRLLLALNVCLALFLGYRIAFTGADAAAAERSQVSWTAGDIRELNRTYAGGQHSLSRLTFDLGSALADVESGTGRPVDLGLRLEPAFPMVTFLHAPRRVELRFEDGLPAGRRYTLHLARTLHSATGRELPAGPLLEVVTPAPDITRVTVVDRDPDGAPALVVWFDQPVDLDALRPLLRLTDPADDAAVPFELDAARWQDEDTVRITPTDSASHERLLLTVAAGLASRGGDVATERALERMVALAGPLRLTGARFDHGAIELDFNRAVDLPTTGLIEVEPAIPFQVFQNGPVLRLVGAFTPGDVVGVRVRAGFPGTGRARMPEDERRSLLVPDRRAELDFARRGSILSARAEPVLEVRSLNIDGFDLSARRVYPNNVVRMLQRGDDRSMAPSIHREFDVRAPRNEAATTRVDLRELLGTDAPRGLFQVGVLRIADDDWHHASRLVQLTDLGVTVRAADDVAAVQVVSIADGDAVADATVRVVSPTNQDLATGTTDARGVAMLRWAADGKDRRAFVVHVQAGADEAFVDMEGCAVELADPELGGRPYAGDEPEAYVWPTRGIARPGERIEAAVLVRDAAGRAVAGREVEVAFEQPNGRAGHVQQLTTPGSGLVTASFDTSPDAPAGTWRIRVRDADGRAELGAAPIQVEAFVPYRLEAEVTAIEPLRIGASCAVRVAGRWLDGAPAAGREVELRVRLLHGKFAPDGSEEFSFDAGGEEPPPGELKPLRGVLDDDGVAEFRLTLPADVAQQTLVAQLIAEVMDPSGRAVRAAVREPVLRPGLHLGVRADATRANQEVALRAVAANGSPIPGSTGATVRLERRRWHWAYRSMGGTRWRWNTTVEAEVLGEWPVALLDGEATLAVDFPSGSGWLAVVATAGDVTAEQTVGRAPARPDRLRVGGPTEPVVPGAIARITVDAPAAGRGFVTLEGPTVLTAAVVDLVQGHNVIEVPVPADARVPNLHVVVTLTRPARLVGPDAGPAWLVGGAAVPLRRDDLVGAIALQAPDRILPDAELTCEVVAPGATTAIVAVVDEGVLAITRHDDPDPIGFFLARRRLAAAGADAFTALMESATFVAGTKTGGDGDDLASMLAVGSISPRIRPVALFAEVALDRDGRGVARFRLPPYEGRVRVMALAAGPGSFAGVARATVVRAPLGLQAVGPRMVAPGDVFAIPVTVHNDTGAAGEVALRCSAQGGIEVVGDGAFTIPALADGAVATVDVDVRAVDGSNADVPATLRLDAALGDERRTVSVDLQVRELRLLREDHFGVALGAAQELRVPDDFLAADLRATLAIDSVPDVHLRPALEALIQYPYGCVEQTTSRGFAVLACQALLPRIYGGDATPVDAAEFVQAAADRLVGMQNAGGEFGWWPGARDGYPFGTIYAMDFLLSAKEQGFRVPDDVLRRGLARVHSIAAGEGRGAADISLRCAACELESRAGRPSRGVVEWLATQSDRAEDRALLAIALQRLGDHQRAVELLDAATGTEDERELGGLLRSPLRARALRFRAELAVDPADRRLPERAWALQRELLRTERLSTQELGQALRALAGYYGTRRADGTARLRGTIDGAPLPEPVDGRIELQVRPGSVLAIEAGGEGFALLTVRGMRPPRADGGDHSLTVQRAYFDPDTGAEVTRFRRGRVYEVRLTGHATRVLENLVIADLLPGGLEAEAPPPGAEARRMRDRVADEVHARIERRDDRVLLFHQGRVHGDFVLSHLVRATFPGRYEAPPTVAEVMYEPGAVYVGTGTDGVEILR